MFCEFDYTVGVFYCMGLARYYYIIKFLQYLITHYNVIIIIITITVLCVAAISFRLLVLIALLVFRVILAPPTGV